MRSLANRFDKFGGSDVQATRQLDDVEQADVSFAAFHSADIVAVQIGLFRQLLLRQPLLKPKLASADSRTGPE